MIRSFPCIVALLAVAIPMAPYSSRAKPFRLEKTRVPLRYVEYEFALRKGADGVPRLDWKRFRERPARLITRRREAVVLENRYFRATVIPSMGRLRSFIHRPSGREQLWINPAAIPIPAHNDTGFWVTWGGVETVLPRGEHGTSHALKWDGSIVADSATRKAVRMEVVEPLTGLKHSVVYSAYPNRRYLETTITLHNRGAEPVRFSHWTTALLAPGGRGELTPRTEFIVPAERFIAAERDFNRWMQGRLGPARGSPLRFAEGWKEIGDLMASPLLKPFYAAYCHEEDAALVRGIDLDRTPGFNIWTWGFPPSSERQREYTAKPPNRGYVEFWNGTARDFTDDARGVLRPGETISWREKTAAVAGIRGAGEVEAALARAIEETPAPGAGS